MSVGITHDYDTDNKCYGIQGETVSKLGECSIAGQTWRMGRIWKEQRTRVNVQMGEEIKWYEQLRWQYASCVRRVTLSVWIDTIVKLECSLSYLMAHVNTSSLVFLGAVLTTLQWRISYWSKFSFIGLFFNSSETSQRQELYSRSPLPWASSTHLIHESHLLKLSS